MKQDPDVQSIILNSNVYNAKILESLVERLADIHSSTLKEGDHRKFKILGQFLVQSSKSVGQFSTLIFMLITLFQPVAAYTPKLRKYGKKFGSSVPTYKRKWSTWMGIHWLEGVQEQLYSLFFRKNGFLW